MAKELVSIKGTRDGLVILYDPSLDFEEIKRNLKNKMESARDFFKGARVNVYHGTGQVSGYQQRELENICREYGLVPSREVQWPVQQNTQPLPKSPTIHQTRPVPSREHIRSGDQGEHALLVSRTLRSGQLVTHNGHIVLMGDLHAGAEVAATGNIVIAGVCRGTVHAGAGGNKKATVTSIVLDPVQLRIAGIKADESVNDMEIKMPRCARLNDDLKVVYEPWLFSKVGREM